MSTWAEKRTALPPIDLSSIVFEDEEDEYECSSSTSSTSKPVSSSLGSSPISSSTSIPSTTSPPSTEPSVSKFLEPTDRNTDFFWAMGIRPLELRIPSRLPHFFVPNNNDVDTIINGPKGQVVPFSRPPDSSPKWGWEPKPTIMRQVTPIVHKLAPTNRSTDFLWPNGIRPFELRGPPRILQPFVPNNNGIDEIINGPKGQVAPATRPPYYSPKWGWEPSLTMMRHVTTIVHKLEAANRSMDFLWPMGIRPLELRGLPAPAQTAVPYNNAMYEIINGPKWQAIPVVRHPKTSPKRHWEPSLTMMRHVWTIEEAEEGKVVLPSPPVIGNGNGMRLVFGFIGVIVFAGLWLLA